MNDFVYAVVRPPYKILKIETALDQQQFDDLVKTTLDRGFELYVASLEDGEFGSVPKMPWILQASCGQSYTSSPVVHLNEFSCPYCPKVLRSASGKTLHIKQKHSDRKQVDEDDHLGANGTNS